MSKALYKLGKYAANRPWRVLGTWLILGIIVVGASPAFGRELVGSTEVPGLDSQVALDLMTHAQSEQAGLTAQIVVTPTDPAATFPESPAAHGARAGHDEAHG